MAEVILWQDTALPRVVQALAEGQLVAFPTETVYGIAASALMPEAVERLVHAKGRPEEKPLTLALSSASQALDWVRDMSPLARRLARRCWPGPITLVFNHGVTEGLAGRLPDGVRQRICPQGTLGLRVPDHDAILDALHHLPGPLVLTSANRSGEPAAITAGQVVDAVGNGVDLVIDDGPCRHGLASTVVQIDGDSWKVLREGVVSAEHLERLSARVIAFVCTGNTCRSPLAQVFCKKLLADKLRCTPDELPQRGWFVFSAGLAAMTGDRATPEAVGVARELGADLENHVSRPLSPELVIQADDLVTMTRSHAQALVARFGQWEPRPRLLSQDGEDIADPIGGGEEIYRDCARQILRHVEALVAQFLPRE